MTFFGGEMRQGRRKGARVRRRVGKMEARMHVLVLGLMAVYTLVLLLLVSRNVHALRTHHACADVSAPLARTLAAMLDAPKQRGAAVDALRAAPLRAVRVAVFGTNGEVVLDTHEGGEGGAPTEEQKEMLFAAERAPTRLVHRRGGSVLAHAASAKCGDGAMVVTEALALS